MKLIETDSGPERLAGERSGGTSSPARRGEGRTTTLVAPRTLAERVRALRSSVWAPVLVKSAGVVLGMFALAAVGASSLARGSGVQLPPASTHPAPAGTATAALDTQHLTALHDAAAGLENPPSDAGTQPPAEAPSVAVTADGKIILNLAGASDLRHLPGIGAKRAEAILVLRAKLGGRFKRVTDLLRVKGIGPKGLKKIEPHVLLDAPKPA
jgi:competence protein ComEA